MKLISFAIPSYNSEDYLYRAVESLLPAGDEAEIIIIDDGSKDRTGQIADEYRDRYPDLVRVIHQENGGHGEGVNQGIRHARGLYYKVIDSDDWAGPEALAKVMHTIRELKEDPDNLPDLLLVNYVYEKLETNQHKEIHYKNALPVEKIFTWDNISKLRLHQYLLMHTAIYKTSVLKEAGTVLPKHTFYVDNIFVYQPLPYVKTLYYLDVDFYHYFIGRDDQSVNEKNMLKRYEQQLRITRIIIDAHDLEKITCPNLKAYMTKYINMMMTISSILLIKLGKEKEPELKALWAYLKDKQPQAYIRISKSLFSRGIHLPHPLRGVVVKSGYKIAQKIFAFN